ncbi:MAG: AAA family ATPase [Deltaproteobacteria bacterium]|nr:AAA family ATPase [Deltaproteobacteria bacterium]
MLTRFHVNNFKSLLNFEFRPAGVNLIIGTNNAGKTNLCSALRFISLSIGLNLDTAILAALGVHWNLTNLHVLNNALIEFEMDCELMNGTEAISFNYHLHLRTRKSGTSEAQTLSVEEERLTASGGPFAQTVLLENRGGKARMLNEEGFVQKRMDAPNYVEARVPDNASMLSQLFELDNNQRAILFRRFLRSWSYYNLSPDALRQPDVVPNNETLSSNGQNLSRVLFDLHNLNPRIERKLIETVRLLEPQLEFFNFWSADPDHIHLAIENKDGYRLGARSISDGTLRFMGLVWVVLMAEYRARQSGFSPLTIIEEPENGLYVGHLKPLIEMIDVSGRSGQFVFTSHSPYFIDLFDDNLDGVHILKPGHPSSILVKPDSQKVKTLLDQMPLGEMHYREMLA